MSLQHDDDDIPGWVRILICVAILGILAMGVGCSSKTNPTPTPHTEIVVDEHTLPDGTRCAVAWSNGGTYGRAIAGGLSCDWQHAEPRVRLPTAADAYITAEGELSWRW